MNPLGLGLILLGAALQIFGVISFAVRAESVQLVPLLVAISLGMAIETAGVLTMLRNR